MVENLITQGAQNEPDGTTTLCELDRILAYQKYREDYQLDPSHIGRPMTQDVFNSVYDITVGTPLEGLIEP